MKTTTVTANAYQLTRLGFVNCYLVREADGLSLIDTGFPGSANVILAAARELGAPIRRIVLTHAHMDHVGSVDALVEKLGSANVELVTHARSAPLLQKPPNTAIKPNEPQGKIKGGVPGIKYRPTQLVAEGDFIGSLRAIETPGHIPGHLSFLDERHGTLFIGDALICKEASLSAVLLRGSFPSQTLAHGTNPPLLPARRSYLPTPSSSLPADTAQSSLVAAPPLPQPSRKQPRRLGGYIP